MKKRGEKNIFIGGSLYSLLLYLLVAKSDDIEQTFFFFSNSMPNEVCQHFNKSYKLRCFKNKILKDILISATLLSSHDTTVFLRFS